jgi:hypothetical protein
MRLCRFSKNKNIHVGFYDDKFVVPRVARAMAAKYRAPLKVHDGFAHHIMTEPGWERPANDIIDWMDQH